MFRAIEGTKNPISARPALMRPKEASGSSMSRKKLLETVMKSRMMLSKPITDRIIMKAGGVFRIHMPARNVCSQVSFTEGDRTPESVESLGEAVSLSCKAANEGKCCSHEIQV